MPRYKLNNGVVIQLTAEEETARDVEEATWEAGKFDRKIAELRRKRTRLLKATDFYALSDVTMSSDMTTYREALRDLPANVDLTNIVYPTKP